ncbi:skin secretory protein xP2-like [Peromyscus leucopus]|uniref:skin secretory protein xP2-like n=1 Tax=Peromyscus leucopus TaxID=10041 RepID=UPI0010A1AC5A|nr:skin secretory protein xP2-like [Peromyscus leucopus]
MVCAYWESETDSLASSTSTFQRGDRESGRGCHLPKVTTKQVPRCCGRAEGLPPPTSSAPHPQSPRLILSLGADAGRPPPQSAGVPGAGSRPLQAPLAREGTPVPAAAPPHSPRRAPTCLPSPGPVPWKGGDPDWQARMGATWVAGEAAPTLRPGRRGLKAQGRELEVLGSLLPSPGLRGSSRGAAPRLLQATPALGPGQDEGCASPRPRPAPGDTHPTPRARGHSPRIRRHSPHAPRPHPAPRARGHSPRAPSPAPGDTHPAPRARTPRPAPRAPRPHPAPGDTHPAPPPPARSGPAPRPPRALRSAPLAPPTGCGLKELRPTELHHPYAGWLGRATHPQAICIV